MGKNGAIVLLDQEKAYDKILHPYLWKVLEKFDLPRHYIRTIQQLYRGATTSVVINVRATLRPEPPRRLN